MTTLRQASMRRLRDFDVRPNRELGQNFLIDDNILDVIGRAAELDPPSSDAAEPADASTSPGARSADAAPSPDARSTDVVLEVGGGLGVLSEYLAPRVAHLHVVEIDRSLEPALQEALAPFDNATLHFADAVKLDLGALRPAPTKVVANLPYGIAATVLISSVADLPETTLWVAMVQREVADRLAASPGGRIYGATSVLVQLACDVQFLRRVPRTVFHPAPNVESALIVMRRHSPAPSPEVAALVHGAFAHRRKALAGSLALVPGAPDDVRPAARAALERIGQPADARAERLPPADWSRLADEIGRERLAELRPR